MNPKELLRPETRVRKMQISTLQEQLAELNRRKKEGIISPRDYHQLASPLKIEVNRLTGRKVKRG